MSNVDTYIGNEVRVLRAQVGDSSNNMYAGVGTGNPYTVTTSGNRNLTAVGVGAGATTNNVRDSVYVGYNTGANASQSDNVIAIGTSIIAGGSSNIFIGNSIGNVGSSNIFIGHGITAASTVTNKLNINNLIYGDFTNKWVGIGTFTRTGGSAPINLDVAGGVYVSGKMGIQMLPSNSLNVNGMTQSTGGFYSSAGTIIAQSVDVGSVIGTLATGTFVVSVQDLTTPSNGYDSGMFLCYDMVNAGDANPPVKLTANASTGYAQIVFSGPNIVAFNTDDTNAHTFRWSITYFPLSP